MPPPPAPPAPSVTGPPVTDAPGAGPQRSGAGDAPAPDPQLVARYRKHVRGMYDTFARYHARQMRWYRGTRVVVIVSAGSIPVLTGVPSVPTWVVAVLGAVAAATEAFVQLFRWRDSAVAAMRTANVLEDHLARFDLQLPPYDGPPGPSFQAFAGAVLDTGSAASRDLLGLWSEEKPAAASPASS
ncbi:DUF4231 domain-containing protein [Oerskovia turbata]